LHEWHMAHGARLVARGRYLVPADYGDVDREVTAARTRLALADVSALAKLGCLGAGVARLAEALGPDHPACKVHSVGMLSQAAQALACRLTEEHILLIAGSPDSASVLDGLEKWAAGTTAVITDATPAYAAFCLVGPHGEEVLHRLTTLNVSTVAWPPGACAETGLAGVHALLVRPPRQDIPWVQLLVSWDLAEYVWDRVLETGRPLGMVPLGWKALHELNLAEG
jgi:glycine cleavage system aminomethyltransferase T